MTEVVETWKMSNSTKHLAKRNGGEVQRNAAQIWIDDMKVERALRFQEGILEVKGSNEGRSKNKSLPHETKEALRANEAVQREKYDIWGEWEVSEAEKTGLHIKA